MNNENLKDEIVKIIEMIDEAIEEQHAREPNAMGIRNLLRGALVRSGYKVK